MKTLVYSGIAAFSLLVIVAAGSASAQANTSGFKFCNAPGYEDLVLVFLNPDLTAREDGLIHASGTFFIQFQARGETALEIETLKFSFGKPVRGAEFCNTPEWITEAVYIKNYRSDNDYRDGFFVPINTYNVGDGEYAAAISVYNADGVEMARGYANAVVENGGRVSGRDPWPVEDFTKPWPIILPGDGERLDGKQGLYVEVAEPVSDIKVYVNGKLAELKNATAPARDDDVIPDLCPPGLLKLMPQACEGQMQQRVWGPAWEWDGVISIEDVIKVVVTDKWGNVAEKVVHIGDPTIGGRVSGGNPEFEIVLDEGSKVTDANGRAVFDVTYRITKDFLHGNVFVRHDSGKIPAGLTVKATPNHVMEGAGKEVKGTITFIAGPTAPTGAHNFDLVVEYLVGQEQIAKSAKLKLQVADRANSTFDEDFASKFGTEAEKIRGTDAAANLTQDAAPPEEDRGFLGLPGPSPGLLVAAAAGVALAVGARRRR